MKFLTNWVGACVATAILLPRLGVAQDWPGAFPIAPADSVQDQPQLAATAEGGAFLAWVEATPHGRGSRVQGLLRSGERAPGWDPNGQWMGYRGGWATVISDGRGGAFAAADGGGEEAITVHQFGPDGARAWGPNGVMLSHAFDGVGTSAAMGRRLDLAPSLVPDSEDGVLVFWLSLPRIGDWLAGARILPDGTVRWTRKLEGSFHSSPPVSCSDHAGGAYVAYVRESKLRVLHVLADGTLDPAWIWSSVGSTQDAPNIVAAPEGCVVAWHELRNGVLQVRALRLEANGGPAAGWPSDGTVVSRFQSEAGTWLGTTYEAKRHASVVVDGASGVYVAWTDFRVPAGDIYLQRIGFDGARPTGWPTDGLRVCGASGVQRFPKLAVGMLGEALVVWQDHRDGNADIYAQRVTREGARVSGWPSDGLEVCVDPANQVSPSVASLVDGRGIVAWVDYRGSDPNVFVDVVQGGAVVATLVALGPADATSERVRLEWLVHGDETIDVQRSDPASAWRTVASLRPDGRGRVVFEDYDVRPGARYGYRLAFPHDGETRVDGERWLDVPPDVFAVRAALEAGQGIDLTLSLPVAGRVALAVIDVTGRIVERRELDGAAGVHALRLAPRPAPGVYWISARQGQRAATARAVLLR